MERPTKPLTSYLLFQSEIREQFGEEIKTMGFQDRAKFVGEKWNALTPEERQEYNNKAKQLKQEYDENIKKFYELYPEEKEKDEEEARQKKEKKLISKDPPEFKPNEKNMKIMYAVAYIKKYYNQNNVFLPCNNASKKHLNEQFEQLQDKVSEWKSAWLQMGLDEKKQVKQFYQEWLQAKMQ